MFPWVHIVTNRNLSWWDLRCCKDINLQRPTIEMLQLTLIYSLSVSVSNGRNGQKSVLYHLFSPHGVYNLFYLFHGVVCGALQSLWLTTPSMLVHVVEVVECCRVLQSRPACPVAILRDKTFRGGKATGGWKGNRRGVDEVWSWQQVMIALWIIIHVITDINNLVLSSFRSTKQSPLTIGTETGTPDTLALWSLYVLLSFFSYK